jgi:hypothetical protein
VPVPEPAPEPDGTGLAVLVPVGVGLGEDVSLGVDVADAEGLVVTVLVGSGEPVVALEDGEGDVVATVGDGVTAGLLAGAVGGAPELLEALHVGVGVGLAEWSADGESTGPGENLAGVADTLPRDDRELAAGAGVDTAYTAAVTPETSVGRHAAEAADVGAVLADAAPDELLAGLELP